MMTSARLRSDRSSAAEVPLLGPLRVRFSHDPDAAVGGAWYPYTVRLADEIPGLLAAAEALFGPITAISVNWQHFHRYPGLESWETYTEPPLMTLTTAEQTVTILVIPPRTASPTAAILLHQINRTGVASATVHTIAYRRATRILDAAATRSTGAAVTGSPSAPTSD